MSFVFVTSFIAVFAAFFPIINLLGEGPIFLNIVQGCSQTVYGSQRQRVGDAMKMKTRTTYSGKVQHKS